MEKDPYRYFRPEATELVGQLGAGLVELEKSGLDAALVAKLFRVAHTLKGAARIVKHRELAELSHALETWMTPLREGGTLPARLDEGLALVDKMSGYVATLGAPPKPATQPLPVAPSAEVIPQRVTFERVDLGDLLDGLADIQVQVAQLRTLDDPRHLPNRIDQIEREVRRVREETEQLQLIPAGSLFPMLTRIVRDAAAPIDLVGRGGDARLEGSVLSVLHGALVQLVRNAIAHGIEPVAERRAAGKPERATITVELTQANGRVSVRVSDDGRGIDLAAVRRALIEKGLAAPALDDKGALIRALIDGGVSTATAVSEMAGRGVGLDVVRAAARELGGELTATTSTAGAAFTLSLPVSMSTLQVLMLATGTQVAAVPLTSVHRIIAPRADRIVTGERSTVLFYDDASLPYAMLAQLVGDASTMIASVVIVDRGDGELVALGVERVLGVKEVVQRARPLGAALDPIVAGLVVDDGGVPRPVLDPGQLAKAVRATRVPAAPEQRKRLPILVIDDSLTTRMLEQSILESAGYEVELASNAEEGLAKAQRNRYALFLVDVEMPGMDGFTFVATTRAHAELSKVPAILVTSRNAPEDLRRGADAGAKGYIVKGEFDQNELLALIGKLNMIRVFVVDDSATVRGRLVELISAQADMVVCGEAANGRDAIQRITALRPDVITLDLALPEVDGLGVTEHVMAVMPTPILIVSASFNRGEVFNTYEALSAGAVDVLDKSADADDEWAQRFISTVRLVSRIKVITHPRGRLRSLAKPAPPTGSTALKTGRAELVAIGASTGGPGAIVDVLAGMPKPFSLPILVVLHVDASFAVSFADWLGQRSGRTVRIPTENELIADATNQVLFAPPHKHLTVAGGRVRMVDGAPRHHCKPSVDVLFESLALDRGARVVAALLTGMGRDGAAGLLAIRRAGGYTIAQDEMSSVVYGMPREAALIGAAERILPLPEIGASLAAAAGVDK